MSTFRVTIPNNLRKTIQNIKEIAGNHTDEEIYAMLRECSMDPNETAQRLLSQDTFHEVKRKRDRRKESNTKEPMESRWRPGMQGRGARGGGRGGGYSSRYVSHDAGSGRNANAGKDNGVNQSTDRGSTSTLPVTQDIDIKATTSPVTGLANGPTNVVDDISTHGHESHVPEGSGFSALEENSAGVKMRAVPPLSANMKNSPAAVIGEEQRQPTLGPPSSEQLTSPMIPAVSGVYSSSLDPVLVPSLDSRVPGVVGTIKREVGSQWMYVEPTAVIPTDSKPVSHESTNHMQINKFVPHDVVDSEMPSLSEKVDSEIDNIFVHGKIPSKSQAAERNIPSEASQGQPLSSHAGGSSSRPSSNYSNRSQSVGLQKVVGPSKEWKPKPTNPSAIQLSSTVGTSEVAPIVVGTSTQSLTSASVTAVEETTSKLQKKLQDLHFSDNRNVIIPNHLQVPEAERSGLSFGSFDASFAMCTSFANGPNSDKIASPPLSESSQEIEETTEEPSSSVQNLSPTDQEGDEPDHPPSPTHTPQNVSPGEADVPSSISPGPEYDQSKSEAMLPPGGPQYSVVHTAPNYSAFGLMPPMLGSQFAPFESSETQAPVASRLPSFVVQPSFDPSTSYYTQFYRPSADGDGRFSPFLAPGAAKYNGNITVLPTQSSPSPQESGNSMVLSTAGQTPLVTQASGVMQNSIAVTQQPVPVFRQPAGVHISHYPPNYIPYNQYFPPFYVPPPTIHHYLSNTGFPQQPPTGGIYQPPAAAAAAASAVKYSLSQYKPGTNAGNSAHIGMPTGYGPYTSAPAGYSPSPVSTGNSTGNEDLSASQYKENNVYITGQQSEGSTVWIPAPGRDLSGLQASSFYNLPPQGQHVTFPTQAGHGAFTGIYHPAQTMAAATVHPLLQQSQTMAGPVEIVGPPTGVYQQPQRPQINWANNY